jgi:hypothetical protein
MAPARRQLMAARGNERFPTEWALYDSDEQEGEQTSHQLAGARPEGWAPISPVETIGHPARRSARLDRRLDGAA